MAAPMTAPSTQKTTMKTALSTNPSTPPAAAMPVATPAFGISELPIADMPTPSRKKGMPIMMLITAPITPAVAPSFAASAICIGPGTLFEYMKNARKPPASAQRKQQLPTMGRPDSTPAITPPMTAAFVLLFILFTTLVKNLLELLALTPDGGRSLKG